VDHVWISGKCRRGRRGARSFSARLRRSHLLRGQPIMSDQPADFVMIVRTQLTTVEALNRAAQLRARFRVTMDVIARTEAKIRMVRQLLESECGAQGA
jgi:hypothetical protein